jgi:hypothetical protein
VGGKLRATSGTWRPAAVATRVHWLRDGREIPGATAWTYRPTAADVRSRLQAVVTATAGGVSSTATSASTGRVAKAASRVRVRTPGVVRKGRLARITVRVSAVGLKVDGRVRIRNAGVDRRVRLTNGRATVAIRARGHGRSVVKVAYLGSDSVARGTARTAYRVRR